MRLDRAAGRGDGGTARRARSRVMNQADIHIFLHEVGHTFGLDDFYDWSPDVDGFLMKAGSASRITEFDAWMLRDWWRHLKSRYGY